MGDSKKSASRKTDGKRFQPRKLPAEHWKEEPDDHDFPAAASYLSLLADERTTGELVAALRGAPTSHGKAKDLLRASRLPLLDPANAHVASDLGKVGAGERLSPVLLVRGSVTSDVALTVADGYHRICASYHIDENADIPYRIADLPAGTRPRTRAGTAAATGATSPRQ